MTDGLSAVIGGNLSRIEEGVAAACRRAARSRSEVALMAVSKLHSVAAILTAASLGLTLFGENRVQEMQAKRAVLAGTVVERALSFHLIGHLQTNKAARAIDLFSSVDSLDSLRLAERLDEAARRTGKRLPVLLEIKLSPEETKSGMAPESRELSELLERLPALQGLRLHGLMTVPPYFRDPEAARPYFSSLRRLRDSLAAAHASLDFSALSMGMSHDYEAAVEEGATEIRIGSALFGPRPAGERRP